MDLRVPKPTDFHTQNLFFFFRGTQIDVLSHILFFFFVSLIRYLHFFNPHFLLYLAENILCLFLNQSEACGN